MGATQKRCASSFRGFEHPAHRQRRKHGLDFSDKDQLKEIDRHIGQRIKMLRKAYGLSQIDLSASLGVSYQQVQKYENATNRLSASRLYAICEIFDISLHYFFLNYHHK
ncbi:helix-turn-helix domain-containing protein [Sneathiella aquimaris]